MEKFTLMKPEIPLLARYMLSKGFNLFAPLRVSGRPLFKRIQDEDEAGNVSLDFIRTTMPPLKTLLIPPRELLFKVKDNTVQDIPLNPYGNTVILGVHPCDVNAADLLERVYLDAPKDPYFEAKRKDFVVIASNCTSFDDYCFCTSFGTGPSLEEGFDALLTDLGNRFLLEIKSRKGSELLEGFNMPEATGADLTERDERIRKVKTGISRHVTTANLQRIMTGALYSPIWGELAGKCTGCGACNMVCPTCFCFNVVDEPELDLRSVARMKTWDGCLLWEYAEVALGGNFRKPLSARLRQFINHKINYWVNQYGALGCVGCGRCIEQCPAGIDITKVVARLRGESM